MSHVSMLCCNFLTINSSMYHLRFLLLHCTQLSATFFSQRDHHWDQRSTIELSRMIEIHGKVEIVLFVLSQISDLNLFVLPKDNKLCWIL